MKNLKMFAVGLAAMAAMTMGVSATGVVNKYPTENKSCTSDDNTACVAKIGNHYYSTLNKALKDALSNDGDEIVVLRNISGTSIAASSTLTYAATTGKEIKTNLTINVGAYDLDLGSATLVVEDKGNLIIKGTGEVKTTANSLVEVKKGGTLTTSGKLLLGAEWEIATVTGGNVTIADGAEISLIQSGSIVKITGQASKVSINAILGEESNPKNAQVVNNALTAIPARGEAAASVTIEGGNYYTQTKSLIDIDKNIEVVINGGELNLKGSTTNGAIAVRNGSLAVNGGTIVSGGNAIRVYGTGKVDVKINGGTVKSVSGAALITAGTATGTVTIEKGTLQAEGSYSPLYLANNKLTYKVNGGTFEGAKEVPVIYIEDTLLTGLAENGAKDPFKGMLTGGKYLYMIIGGTADKKHSPEDVAKYIIAEGLEEKTEGNYKLLGNGANEGEPTPGTDVNPGSDGETQNPTDETNVPKTGDNIMTFMGLGLASIAVVGLGAKKLKKQTN